MSTQIEPKNKKNAYIAGGILIVIGLMSLAANLFALPGFLVLLAPGALFLVWGMLMRSTGLIIPGSILSGLATGVYLVEGPMANLQGESEGAAVLLSLAGGFFLITLLSLYTARGKLVWWPLIPGGIMATIGGLLLSGEPGLKALEYFGQGWPIILVAVGLYLILRRKDMTE